jgi:hypothetical protein
MTQGNDTLFDTRLKDLNRMVKKGQRHQRISPLINKPV